ncbi:MAG: hypothetical protein EZS28_001927 [Streblomastix strix]|uniref:Uncharacterized protein n=1 Tax=Streblomastix strix TaxID=222440 RepID=A0A5J4X7E5_9EUKA|nr:MAG: hypothetical protein EZS28_001927 [Streblomastix strix]
MQDKKKESDESNNKMKIRKIKKNTTLQTFIDQLESIFEQISLPPTLRGQSIDELGSLELASLARDSIQQKKLTTVLVPILINLLATQNASEAYFAIQQISRLVNPLQFSNENGNKDSHTLIQPYQKQIVVQTAIAFATNPLFFANLRQHLLINYPMRIHVAILSMLYWLSNACELIGDVSVLNQDQLRDSTVHKPICPFYCGDAIVGSNMIRITGNGDGIKPMQNSFRKKVKNDEKKKKNESKSNQKKNDKKEEEERKLKEKEKEKEIENKEKKKSKKPDKKEKQKQFLSTSLNDVQIRHRDMRYDDIRANLKSSGSRGRERSIERDNKSSFIRRENETYKDKDKKKRLGSVDVSEDQKHKSKHKRHNSVDAVQKKSNDKENQKDKERRKLIEELKIPEKNKKNDKSKQSDKDESKKDKQKEINKENEPPQKLIFESTDAQKQDLNATTNTSTSTNPENKHDTKQEDIKQPQQQDTTKDDKQQQQQTKQIQPSITDDTTAKQSKSPLPKSDSPSADSDERQGDSDMSDTSDTPQPTNISGDIEPQVQLQVSALGNKKEAMATFGVFDDREDDEDDEYMTQFSQGLGLRMQMYSGPGGNTEINAGKNINQQRVNDSMDDTQNSRNEKDKQKKKKKKKNQDGEDDSDSDSDSESSSSDDEDESNSSSEEDYDEEINTKETKTSVSQNKDDTTSSNKSKQDKKSKSKSNTRKTNQESGKSDKKERNDETQRNTQLVKIAAKEVKTINIVEFLIRLNFRRMHGPI